MGVLDGTEILLNGETYKLLREALANKLSRRRWTVEQRRIATKRIPRSDVRPGEVEGDYAITWADWSKGICGDHENLIGCLHYGEGAHGLIPGSLRPAWCEQYQGWNSSIDHERAPAKVIDVWAQTWVAMGRYIFSWINEVLTLDHDMGAGIQATSMEVHNNELVVGAIQVAIGSSRLHKRSQFGTWTVSADAAAITLAPVEDRLWRGSGAFVSNLAPTDDPAVEANWGGTVRVGNDNMVEPMTLVPYGEHLAVLNPRGIFVGDRAATFPNVFDQGQLQAWDNGKRGTARGGDVFYPHRRGLTRWDGASVEEVGLHQHFPQANADDQLPGLRFTATCVDGNYLWGATALSGFPHIKPTGVRFTQNNGGTYTDITAPVTDSALGGVGATLNNWDTLANQDFMLIGSPNRFYGLEFLMFNRNDSGCSPQVAFVTAPGTPPAATTLPVVCSPYHQTGARMPYELDGFLFYSGILAWLDRGSDLAGWVPTTINGLNAYWIRLSLTTPAAASITIREIRVLPNQPRSHVFRGRPARAGDVRNSSIIWEPFTVLDGCHYPTTIAAISPASEPSSANGAIIVACKQRLWSLRRDLATHQPGPMAYPGGGNVVSSKHDGGTPEVDKAFTYFRVKGRTIDSNHTVKLEYRLNEDSTWLVADAAIATSPKVIMLPAATNGRMIQWRATFNAFQSDVATEINEIEVGFRELIARKEYGSYLLEVYDDASLSQGGDMPDSDVQLTRLEALVGAGAVPFRDATQRSKSVTVESVKQQEVFQEALDYPVLAVEVQTAEV